jgi:phage terminase large subunit-like protein
MNMSCELLSNLEWTVVMLQWSHSRWLSIRAWTTIEAHRSFIKFRKMVRKQIHLMNVCLDITYVVNLVS